MLFSSMTFLWIFLPIVLGLYFLIPNRKAQNFILVTTSLLFYAWGEPRNIFIILFSIALNYAFGLLVAKAEKTRSLWLTVCVLINLGLLFYYKYYTFFCVSVLSRFGIMVKASVTLPIGISFFTFQALSYVVDVYRGALGRGNTKVQKNIVNLAFYISFFPQLIAGPIVKYYDIEEQITQREVSAQKFSNGIKRFVIGLSKKVLISNVVAAAADAIFKLPIGSLGTSVAWIGVICYALQIYYDFSGYSDMAIGLGKMMGFTFIENFNFPYISRSITEFWRRWHISLSTWFREYLYIPLGGNRKGKVRTYVNLGIVFFATGIWHGANWTFLFWGLFHGFFMILERLFLGKLLKRWKGIGWLYTILVVLVGWVFFRADSLHLALGYLKAMFVYTPCAALSTPMYFINPMTIFIAAVGIFFMGMFQERWPAMKNWLYGDGGISFGHVAVLIPLMLFCILSLSSNAYNPFIYYRF